VTETWPIFDPGELLRRLTAAGVDFVVVGGIAAVLLGSPRMTRDVDVTYAPDPANLETLGRVLVALEARLRGAGGDVAFVPDARSIGQTEILTLATRAGDLDLIRAPSGGSGYPRIRRRAERVDIGGCSVLVASLDDLLAMKRAAGRPKDLADVDELEAIRRLRRRGGRA